VNKQESVQLFLNNNITDLVGLVETKMKAENMGKVAYEMFGRLIWTTNRHLNPKVRI